MKKRFLKSTAICFAIVGLALSMTSCNKGYGCPNNFKVENVTVKAAKTVANTVVAICK